ncbi:13526_t:CDS:2, partial [Cetraspora pellucida]
MFRLSDNKFSDSDLPSLIPIFTGRQNGIAITRSFKDYYLSHISDKTDLISAIVNYLRENSPTRMHKAKISFEYSPKTCVCYAKIVIDDMSISLIEKKNNKASFSKNNLSHSETEINKPDLNLEKFIDMFKKLFIETNLSSSDLESTGLDWYNLDLKKPERNASILQRKRLSLLVENIIEISQLEL